MSPPAGVVYETRPGLTSSSGGARIQAPFNQKLSPRDHFYRAAWVHVRSNATRQPLDEVSNGLYGRSDEVTPLLLRATTAPATTTTQGWAVDLAAVSVLDMLLAIGPAYASSALIPLAANVEFPPGVASVTVPDVIVSAAGRLKLRRRDGRRRRSGSRGRRHEARQEAERQRRRAQRRLHRGAAAGSVAEGVGRSEIRLPDLGVGRAGGQDDRRD
jgi:hypothetical protein